MKRLFSVFMVLILCLAMAVPAFASEQEEHIFEIMPSISMLADFDFLPDSQIASVGVCEGFVPEGDYAVYIIFENEVLCSSISPVSIRYVIDDSNDCYVADFNVTFYEYSIDDVFTLGGRLYDFYDSLGSTILGFYLLDDSESVFPITDGVCVRLVEINNSTQLSDFIIADNFMVLLDQLVSMLPVILAVLVGCIGLRKAIALLLDVLRSS